MRPLRAFRNPHISLLRLSGDSSISRHSSLFRFSPLTTSSLMEYENAETVSHLCTPSPIIKMGLIIVFRIIRCPFDNAQFLITPLGIMHLLVCFVIRIQLIAAVVEICPIRFIVRIILISPGIQLFLCVGFSRHFFHGFSPFRAKKSTPLTVRGNNRISACFTRTKSKPTLIQLGSIQWCKAVKHRGDNQKSHAATVLTHNEHSKESISFTVYSFKNIQIHPATSIHRLVI